MKTYVNGVEVVSVTVVKLRQIMTRLQIEEIIKETRKRAQIAQ